MRMLKGIKGTGSSLLLLLLLTSVSLALELGTSRQVSPDKLIKKSDQNNFFYQTIDKSYQLQSSKRFLKGAEQ